MSNREINELKRIIDEEDIEIVFQPIVSLKDSHILGYEALTRCTSKIFNSPLKLYKSANKYNMLFKLERLSRKLAFQKADKLDSGYKLFLNVDPRVISDKNHESGVTRDMLSKISLPLCDIVIELTERTLIEDFDSFKLALDHYREQGFNIAIDDTGAGYSGLKSLVSISFNYIKTDRSLVQNINNDPVKQALMETFIIFTKKINSRLIAEGIETKEELSTLIKLGVDYGQGFYISRPHRKFRSNFSLISNIINNKPEEKLFKQELIGRIALIDFTVTTETKTSKVINIFENNKDVHSVVVLEEQKPVGLIMRDKLYYRLGSKYGYAVYIDRPVKLIMNDSPMIVNYNYSVIDVSRKAMKRKYQYIYDSIIVVKDGKYCGSVSIKYLLEKVSKMQIAEAKQLNPLTNLPGNPVIEKEIKQRIEGDDYFSFLYIDLDNFKGYNDSYGYKMGDDVIIFTANILEKACKEIGNRTDFLGHIGGDDFVIITTPDKEIDISNYIIDAFDKNIQDYYLDNKEDDKLVSDINKWSSGNDSKKITISIAIVNSKRMNLTGYLQISDVTTILKKYAKKIKESVYIQDYKIIKDSNEVNLTFL
ncbi:MAG: GGDEF domain-containing protein [Halothermotrichaceae bacterium]